jgi:hypothetical protein
LKTVLYCDSISSTFLVCTVSMVHHRGWLLLTSNDNAFYCVEPKRANWVQKVFVTFCFIWWFWCTLGWNSNIISVLWFYHLLRANDSQW